MINKNLLFAGNEYSEYANFWSNKLNQSNPFLFKKNHLQVVKNKFHQKKLQFDEKFEEVIKTYTDNRDLEVFVFLLSSIYILLNKYGNKEITLNTPVLAKADDTIWEPEVPMMLSFKQELTLKDLVKSINNEVVTNYKYQNYPFDLIKDKTLKDKLPLSNILVTFSTIHAEIDKSILGNYDFIFNVKRGVEGKLEIVIDYKEGIESTFVEYLLGHYKRITSCYNILDTKINEIEILSEEEKNQLIWNYNKTHNDFPLEKRVIEIFEEQAAKTPDAIALIFKDSKLTYKELNGKSNSLAQFLLNETGIKTNDRIGSLYEKSELAVISLLGILKAGATYVPIDPTHPKDRIEYILQDAQINTLLTVSDYLFKLENYSGNLIALDIQNDVLDNLCPNVETSSNVSDPAYIIYTSGSTGKPKGVLIEHQGLVNVALDHIKEFEMSTKDVYFLFMSLSFDGSLLDIFTTLLSGAALFLPDKDTINNTNSFIRAVNKNKVTVLTITPSYLNAINKNTLESVRILVSAGEAARIEDAKYYSKSKKFYNGYGPSEVTVNATLYKVDHNKDYKAIPIGKPRANKEIYILDEDNNLLPEGIPGELCIAGIGLAKGYINDEKLTNEKFIIHPYKPGKRLYRSGDLGFWNGDGNIEYLGRNDEQVKLNGFRVDLGEIEKTIQNHHDIKSTIVLIEKGEKSNEKKAVAFYEKESKIELVPSLGEYFIYDSFLYDSMAKDEMRVKGYKQALKDSVKGKVVLDPGTGSEMILARHCVEAGAKKVYAVEIDYDSFETAKKNLVKYALEDKITLIHGDISKVNIPEKIDFVVSALAGNVSSSDGCIPIVNKLKDHLKYPVRFIPNIYNTYISAVGLSERNLQQGFSDISQHYISKVYEKNGYNFDLRLCLKNFNKECIISDSAICESLNYENNLKAEETSYIRLNISKKEKISGLVCWINAYYEDLLMIDSLEKTHHLPVYFPAFEKEIEVNVGEIIEFAFTRKLSDNGLNPDYFIKGEILRANGEAIPFEFSSYNHEVKFRSNALYKTFFGKNGDGKKLEAITEKRLKEWAAGVLPAYMLPNKFIAVDNIPLTANSKVDKEALLKLIEVKETKEVTCEPPRTKVERLLVDIWSVVLGSSTVGITSDFFMLGGDSIKAIQIASRLYKEGYKVEVKHIFENPVLMDLAIAIKPQVKVADQEEVLGFLPLSPVQKAILTSDYSNVQHYNQAVLLHAKEGFGEEATRVVFNKIQEHHDVLRITFHKNTNGAYTQFNNNKNFPLDLECVNLINDTNPSATLENVANSLQKSIDLEKGPLMKLALFNSIDGDYLLIVIHHLVIDGISWRILFEDIDTLFKQYKSDEDLLLSAKTDSFKTWSEKLNLYANEQKLLKEINYWKALESAHVPAIEKDFNTLDNYIKDNSKLAFTINEVETQLLLTKANKAFNTEINDILLSALAMSVERTFNHNQTLITLEGHGREEILGDVDISRTVGWFTCAYPVLLVTDSDKDIETNIKSVKDQLHRIPNKGIGYSILRYLTNNELKQNMDFNQKPQISFNYLGQFDEDTENTFFEISQGSVGNTLNLEEQRQFDLQVLGMISDKKFSLSITYNKKHFKQETIKILSNNYKTTLLEILALCASKSEGELTPTDYTYKELSIEDLDSIFD